MSNLDGAVEAEVRAAQLKQALGEYQLRKQNQQGWNYQRADFGAGAAPSVRVTLEVLAAIITAINTAVVAMGFGDEKNAAAKDLLALIAKAREVACGKANEAQTTLTPEAEMCVHNRAVNEVLCAVGDALRDAEDGSIWPKVQAAIFAKYREAK